MDELGFGSPESLSSGSSSSSESNSPTPVPSMKAEPADRKILEELRTMLAMRYTTYHRYEDTIYWKRLFNPNDPKLPVLDEVFKITKKLLNDASKEVDKYEVVRLHDRVNSLDPLRSLAKRDGQQTSIEILRSHEYSTTSSKTHWKTIFSRYNDLTSWDPYIAKTETDEVREARQWQENEMFMSIANGRKDAEAKVRNAYGLPGDGEESENKFLILGERQRSRAVVSERAERSKAREQEAQEHEGHPSTVVRGEETSPKSSGPRSRSPASRGIQSESNGSGVKPVGSKSGASAQHPHSGASQQHRKGQMPDRLAETSISDDTETKKKKKGSHAPR